MLVLLAGGLVWPAHAQVSNTSQVRYNTVQHDFGKIQETDGPVSFTFEFTNTSQTPFIIEFISVSCGCTTPDFKKEPVLPGRSGSITVTFNPAGRPGVFNTPVIVTSNNRRDQVTLTLTGEVIPRPKTIEDEFPLLISESSGLRATGNNLLFGYMGRGSKKSQTIDLYNNGNAPIALGYRFTSEMPAAGCAVTFTPATLGPKQRGQVTFTYDLTGANVWGLQNVSFVLTENGRATNKPLTAFATATDDFSNMTEAQKANAPKGSFDVQFNHFGSVGRNQTLSHDFTLTNTGKSPLLIRDIKANSSRISYNVPKTTIAPNESIVIRVTLKTPAAAERVSESVSIVVNDPARPMRELRLGANVE